MRQRDVRASCLRSPDSPTYRHRYHRIHLDLNIAGARIPVHLSHIKYTLSSGRALAHARCHRMTIAHYCWDKRSYMMHNVPSLNLHDAAIRSTTCRGTCSHIPVTSPTLLSTIYRFAVARRSMGTRSVVPGTGRTRFRVYASCYIGCSRRLRFARRHFRCVPAILLHTAADVPPRCRGRVVFFYPHVAYLISTVYASALHC